MDWKGKTALITGGVSGIGFGIARAFCAAQIDLILTYRDEASREQAERWFADNGSPTPRFVTLDVTDRRRWAELAEQLGPVPRNSMRTSRKSTGNALLHCLMSPCPKAACLSSSCDARPIAPRRREN